MVSYNLNIVVVIFRRHLIYVLISENSHCIDVTYAENVIFYGNGHEIHRNYFNWQPIEALYSKACLLSIYSYFTNDIIMQSK